MTHPYVETVRRYFRGCNLPDRQLMIDCFTPDIIAYWIDRTPIKGAEAFADLIVKGHGATGARWTLDHGIASGDEAVVEWTMLWRPKGASEDQHARGVDWFHFKVGRIAEIHQYHNATRLRPGQPFELFGFPYADKDYPTKESFARFLP